MFRKTDDYFLTIVKEGNLHKAAEVLYVTQPSLTKYIQRLETQLGTALFDRNVSPMQLNEAGKLYYQYLLSQQEQEQTLITQLDELAGKERGTLRIGIPSYCGQCYLPRVLPAFHNRYPNVNVELHEEHGSAIEQALIDHHIDLGILHLPIVAESLCCEELFNETVLLAQPASAKTKNHTLVSLDNLQDTAFIMPHAEQKLGKIVSNAFSHVKYNPNVLLRTENVLTMLSLVAQGFGAGFIPAGGLQMLPQVILDHVNFHPVVQLQKEPWKLISLTRKDSHIPIYTRFFIDLLKNCNK